MDSYFQTVPRKAPLDEKLMVFLSGPEFSNNALSFWEYIKKSTTYKPVWFIHNPFLAERLKLSGQDVACVAWDSVESYDIVARAKYVVCENWSPHPTYPKYQGQVLVQLRSTLSFYEDYFAMQPMNSRMKEHIEINKVFSSLTDMYMASSPLMRVIGAGVQFADARKFYVTGTPRLDTMLASRGRETLLALCPQLAQYKTIIGYFPTTKLSLAELNGKDFGKNLFNLDDFDIDKLNEVLEEHNAAIVYKLHHEDEWKGVQPQGISALKHVFSIDSELLFPKGIYHVLNAFDMMITDCSSLANEYLLIDRPILFNQADANEMIIKPFIEDINIRCPGIRFDSMGGLCDGIERSLRNPGEYAQQRAQVKRLFHTYDDSGSCARVLRQMESLEPFDNLDLRLIMQSSTAALEAERVAYANLEKEYHKIEKLYLDTYRAYESSTLSYEAKADAYNRLEEEYAKEEKLYLDTYRAYEEVSHTLLKSQEELSHTRAKIERIEASKTYRLARGLARVFGAVKRPLGR